MATKVYCDRCGKEANGDVYKDTMPVEIITRQTRMSYGRYHEGTSDRAFVTESKRDICSSCYSNFLFTWLDGKKK